MKKLLLATAITALTTSVVQAAPTVYGKLNVSIDSMDEFATTKADTNNVVKVNSNASRFGIKGSEELNDKLSAIYLAEWQINVDGDGSDLGQRNRYLGLKYKDIGSVKVGKIDSPLKEAQGKIDYFNDLHVLDMGKVLAGENRVNNVILLESDSSALQGFGVNFMLQQAENSKLDNNSADVGDSLGDAMSASLTYKNKDMGLSAALAGDKNIVSTFNAASSAKAEADIVRLVASLDMAAITSLSGLTFNALMQSAEPTNLSTAAAAPATAATPTQPAVAAGAFYGFDKEDSFLLSAAYKIAQTPWTVKAQYQQSQTSFDNKDDVTLSQFGGMLDYTFNAKTRAYGYLAQQQDDRKNVDDRNYFGLGMEYNF